jgi:hypothetical protein
MAGIFIKQIKYFSESNFNSSFAKMTKDKI